jgi:nucleoside-diphosphate-sugar epimerase
MSPRALLFGARGQIGHFLLPRLRAAAVPVAAVTRGAPPADRPNVQWLRGELFAGADLDLRAEWVFSCGPLDGFTAWFARSSLRPARIVAFSSTSAASKQDSSDPAERALAARLCASETQLLQLAQARGAHLTVLRPTLVYGAGLDRNLSRIVQVAARWRLFVLPRGATGLRQPVHADDLAAAALAAAAGAAPPRTRYDLPGGETLPYREMVQRVLATLDPPARLLELPAWTVRGGLRLTQLFGRIDGAGSAMLARLRSDLVFDAASARAELGYAPRAFQPGASMFVATETS